MTNDRQFYATLMSLTRILFDSLNSLQRRFLITFEEIITIVRLDINNVKIHNEATIEEIGRASCRERV